MTLWTIKNALLLGIIFIGSFRYQGATAACDQTFSEDEGTFTLTVSNSEPVCDAYVSGPNNSIVLLGFTISNAQQVTLKISDQWTNSTTLLYNYTGGEIESPTTNLYSFSPNVLLELESNGADFQLDVSYTIEDQNSLTTLLNSTGEIQVSGDSNSYVNFQHTWKISADTDNFLYFYIDNVTLDDAAGDFLAVGTGYEVFEKAPALMLTSTWLNYPTIHLNGTEGYVYLFMKSYSPNLGVSLHYDTWLYTPPTFFPPFTKPPLQIIDAYFYYDDDNDNYHDVVTNFTKYVEKYAYQYCQMKTDSSGKDHLPDYPLMLDVEVAQVVETNPCLVVEFYIDILNGTCLKDISFSIDDFGWLIGNFSDQFNSDFGREVMFDCPMKLLWVLAVALVAFVSVLVIIFVGFKSKDIEKTSMASDNENQNLTGEDNQAYTMHDEESYFPERRQSQPNLYNTRSYPDINYSDTVDAPIMDLNAGNLDDTTVDNEATENQEMAPLPFGGTRGRSSMPFLNRFVDVPILDLNAGNLDNTTVDNEATEMVPFPLGGTRGPSSMPFLNRFVDAPVSDLNAVNLNDTTVNNEITENQEMMPFTFGGTMGRSSIPFLNHSGPTLNSLPPLHTLDMEEVKEDNIYEFMPLGSSPNPTESSGSSRSSTPRDTRL